ncbi:proton myo-inositol cotransporter [Amanita rubescens]|nr:proton myo-inositol cotransporter [Amanita rubescens]
MDDKPSSEKRETEVFRENPLDASQENVNLMADGDDFAKSHGLGDLSELFQKGALKALQDEVDHKWRHPAMLYYLVILCSVAAAVQGVNSTQMDETVINGANIFFADQFGINPDVSNRNQWLLGVVNSAPYLCCAVIGCWLTGPLNSYFGRRGTIFITAFFSFATCIWQGVTNSWEQLFVARFILGLGIGPKSATVPVYAAECAPPAIRGALVMMWQTWTAFGIMIGFVCDLMFFRVPDRPHIRGLNWRLMLASAGIPALFLLIQVLFCPESPRWYVSKGRYDKAFQSLVRLRKHPLQAARDLYYMHVLLEAEKSIQRNKKLFFELFTVPRNRRATLASFIVMFICGVNVIAYYSSNIFLQANFSQIQALLASFGFGALNFLFAFPAVYTIDTFGRRNLLLVTMPFMAVFLLMTGFAFWIPAESTARIGVIALGVYLYTMVYSPGMGPVPFTYSAEAFPLYVRDIVFATAVLWFFNFVISITFPRSLGAFKPQGAFGWYAAWNIIGFLAVLLFLPETKALSLGGTRPSVPTKVHAVYQLKMLQRIILKYLFGQKVEEPRPLYQSIKKNDDFSSVRGTLQVF